MNNSGSAVLFVVHGCLVKTVAELVPVNVEGARLVLSCTLFWLCWFFGGACAVDRLPLLSLPFALSAAFLVLPPSCRPPPPSPLPALAVPPAWPFPACCTLDAPRHAAWKNARSRLQLAGPHMLSTQVQALVREYFAGVGTPFRRHLRRDIIAVR